MYGRIFDSCMGKMNDWIEWDSKAYGGFLTGHVGEDFKWNQDDLTYWKEMAGMEDYGEQDFSNVPDNNDTRMGNGDDEERENDDDDEIEE